MNTPRGPLLPIGTGRAHVERIDPSPRLRELVTHFWVATWEIPVGAEHEQRVLTYPACNLVVENGTGTLYGPVTRLSIRRLAGTGSALGVLLRPATGALLSPRPMPEIVDSSIPASACGMDQAASIDAALRSGGTPERSREVAIREFEGWLLARLPDGADEDGLLLNRICRDVETTPGLQRVQQLTDRWQISERRLQRLVRSRLGITPKWLLQRHRLQEAAQQIGRGMGPDLSRLAYALGYADQAHFTRDFSSVTGMSPGEYMRQVDSGTTAPQPEPGSRPET